MFNGSHVWLTVEDTNNDYQSIEGLAVYDNYLYFVTNALFTVQLGRIPLVNPLTTSLTTFEKVTLSFTLSPTGLTYYNDGPCPAPPTRNDSVISLNLTFILQLAVLLLQFLP